MVGAVHYAAQSFLAVARTLNTSRLGPPIFAVCGWGSLRLAARLETLAHKWSDDGVEDAQIWSVMVRRLAYIDLISSFSQRVSFPTSKLGKPRPSHAFSAPSV